MPNLNLNLKWKILSGVTLTSTLAVIVSSVIFGMMELSRIDSGSEEQALFAARVVGANTAGSIAFYDDVSAERTLTTLSNNRSIVAAALYDSSGTQVARYTTPGTPASSLPARAGTTRLGRTADNTHIELFDPVRFEGDQVGTIYLRMSLANQSAIIASFMKYAVLTIAGVAVMALGISFLVRQSIVRPINQVVGALRDIAEGDGDLTQRLHVRSTDEIGQLAHWFNVFVGRVHQIVTRFKDSSFNLTAAAEQLSKTTSGTSSGAGKQQAEIGQVAAAMAEMAATVEEVARNVGRAASDAESADGEAKKGAGVVSQTMESIEALAEDIDRAAEVIVQLQKQTEGIGSVLDVIRGIAEQTNLLALNAAIEAARAGEQGRGFAVVADEVRTLASRTQASTEEIQEMIQKLQTGARQAVQVMSKGKEQASSTVEQAARAGQSLQAITRAVSVIRDMSNQIASASEEQSAVTIEIKQNINNISQVANETASGSREISSGASELARLAVEMKTLVGQFKV